MSGAESVRRSEPARTPGDVIRTPYRLALGLERLKPGESWLEIDAGLDAELAEKRRLFREHRDQVFVEQPGSRDAQQEVLACVARALAASAPDRYALEDAGLRRLPGGDVTPLGAAGPPPLERAALCVQEDLCLMERSASGWCLTAASVCFPTRWDLPSKLGLPLSGIHARVPGYHEGLERPTDRFFDGMKEGAVYRRANWSLLDDPSLFQPGEKQRRDRNPGIDAGNAGERVWLRVERQTLQRLPRTGAVLFTIRVHQHRIAELAAERGAGERLLGAIRSMPAEMQAYKSLAAVRDATLAYLEARRGPALRAPDPLRNPREG